jgi:hypothetical protein
VALTNAARDHITKAIIGSSLTSFNNANAYLGVGGGAGATNAFAATQTDLQGASKTRKAMDSTYPTDPPSPSNRLTFRSTFATGDANYAWEEWGTFNASAAGTMLNRSVGSLGTKTSAASWQLTVTIDLSV